MKDSIKCQHTLPEDVTFKEVVIIGNGPSGMVASFMLAGNVPYLKNVPEDLPIDEMLRARLSNLPEGQSLYETDLMELAEGLEGRSHNPIPLLMDNLLRPCADLGIQADSLIEWRYDVEKQIDHIVLGRGPPGGAWHTFPPTVRTLSPAAWLTLPPHAPRGAARLSARAVAHYCRRYVHACKLQRYFRCNVIVTSVTLAPHSAERCLAPHCPLAAHYCVTGYDKTSGRQFRYLCARVVLASGATRANTLPARHAAHALHARHAVERALRVLSTHTSSGAGAGAGAGAAPAVLVVGSGVSAADAVALARARGLPACHVHRTPADALARLDPHAYPDYCEVYKMMSDGPSGNHHHYTPFPHHVIVQITPERTQAHLNTEDVEEYNIGLKRVKLLNIVTNETQEILVNVISVFIGSKPDLFFLQTNFNLNCIDIKTDCQKCVEEKAKRKLEDKCTFKNHWHYLQSVLGQSIQICKSRYLNDEKCICNDKSRYLSDEKCICNDKSRYLSDEKCICNDKSRYLSDEKCICDDKCDNGIPYSKFECQCETVNPFTDGIGFGIDADKPVDSRNPMAVDKSTHEVLNSPKGMYAIGPLTADNFMRFIPGGALAVVAHMHKEK